MQLNGGQLAILKPEIPFLTSSHDVTLAFAKVTKYNWNKGELLRALYKLAPEDLSQSVG